MAAPVQPTQLLQQQVNGDARDERGPSHQSCYSVTHEPLFIRLPVAREKCLASQQCAMYLSGKLKGKKEETTRLFPGLN